MKNKTTIDQAQMETDLFFISDTDFTAANLEVDVERKAYALKQIKANRFLFHKEGSIKERECEAEVDKATQDAVDDYIDAKLKYKEIENQRKISDLRVGVWRSVNKNMMQG